MILDDMAEAYSLAPLDRLDGARWVVGPDAWHAVHGALGEPPLGQLTRVNGLPVDLDDRERGWRLDLG